MECGVVFYGVTAENPESIKQKSEKLTEDKKQPPDLTVRGL